MNVNRNFPKKDFTNKKINKLFVLKFKEYKVKPYGRVPVWLCQCDCGNLKDVTTNALTNGQHSCGCSLEEYRKNCVSPTRIEEGRAMFNELFGSYKYRAKQKNIEFTLSEERFEQLIKSSCFYCNSEPRTVKIRKTSNGGYIHNGIDRIDSSQGYIEGNIVSCCEICNKAKRDISIKDFSAWIKQLTTYANKINFNYTTFN